MERAFVTWEVNFPHLATWKQVARKDNELAALPAHYLFEQDEVLRVKKAFTKSRNQKLPQRNVTCETVITKPQRCRSSLEKEERPNEHKAGDDR